MAITADIVFKLAIRPLSDFYYGLNYEDDDEKTKGLSALSRTVIAAATAFAIYKTGYVYAIFATGAILSLPSAFLLSGAMALNYGVHMIVAAVAKKVLADAAIGLGTVAVGHLCVAFHDLIPIGIIDLQTSIFANPPSTEAEENP